MSGNQFYASNIFVANTLLRSLIFFLLAPGFGVKVRIWKFAFYRKKLVWIVLGVFFAKKPTILQSSLKRKCNHDAKPSDQLNHFYLDFISQALMIYREWEVRGNHI